jgi:phosphate transport system permease protein
MSVIGETQRPAEDVGSDINDITSGDLAGRGMMFVALGAVALGALSWLPFGAVNWARWFIVGLVAYIALVYFVSRRIESRRNAVDRLATAVMMSAFFIVLLPLISLVWTVVSRGSARFDSDFFTETMRGVFGDIPGGGYHAIIGTLIVTGLATLFSVPFGLFTAIYIVEYSGTSKFSKSVTALVDVMTGIPSIVAGLFAYALFVLLDGPGHRSGLAGAVALTLLMTPVVVRASEEMLRLVPNELREASYALGVPKWRTIAKVVLPTAVAGILTGIVLAIARVIGETAPLLVTVGLAQGTNWNPFDGRMTTLPVLTYYQYVQPGVPPQAGLDRAWTSALVLVLIVAILFTSARIMSSILKPKGLR